LEFYDELDTSVWRHSRQIVWKNIWILTNDWNILKFNLRCSIGARVKGFWLWKIEDGRFVFE
jgi:hypothetical protein